MSAENSGEASGEVAAMQFAGGMTIAQVAEAWERDAEWVEAAIRRALLETIPVRDGGLKVTRIEARAERRAETMTADVQATLEFDGGGITA